MRFTVSAAVLLTAWATLAEARTYKEMFGVEPPAQPAATSIVGMMDFKQGTITLPGAGATLDIPQGYYFLDSKDTNKVLVDLWGNPPGSAGDVLGMVFPAKLQPDKPGLWGAVVSYEAEGFVSDDDAASTNFDDLLQQLQESTAAQNAERQKTGYEPIKLVGWASPPLYDKQTHALHWARDLLFGTDPSAPHTLNYQLRMLGREGVLELDFVASMSDLPEVKASIPAFIGLAHFNPGNTYGDYKDGDKIAAYGLAGLIAAGAGAKLAAKVGILGVALLFFKKFFVVFLIAVGAIFKPIMSFFRRKPDGTA